MAGGNGEDGEGALGCLRERSGRVSGECEGRKLCKRRGCGPNGHKRAEIALGALKVT